MQAYHAKCRPRREIKDTRNITMRNGKPIIKGVCTMVFNNLDDSSSVSRLPYIV